jgi:hypothetical protein
MKFSPAGRGKKPTTFKNVNRVLVPDCGFSCADNYLRDGESIQLRLVPSFDETGKAELALNPEVRVEDRPSGEDVQPEDYSSYKNPIIGRCFFIGEYCSLWTPAGRYTFLSDVRGDEAGNEPADWRSPMSIFANRLGYKTYENVLKKQLGKDVDIPARWFQWKEDGLLNRPRTHVFVQCIAQRFTPATKTMRGEKTAQEGPIPRTVFVIPRSASSSFLDNITDLKNPNTPLSLENNIFGDFISPEKGRLLLFKKTKASDKTTYQLLPQDVLPVDEKTLASLWSDWEKILYRPTVEELIGWIKEMFGNEATDFAFRESEAYAPYLPEEVRGTSSNIPEPVEDVSAYKAALAEQASQFNFGANVNQLSPEQLEQMAKNMREAGKPPTHVEAAQTISDALPSSAKASASPAPQNTSEMEQQRYQDVLKNMSKLTKK